MKPFDELLNQVVQRVIAYQRSAQPDMLLGEDALREAADLWLAAQQQIPDPSTPEDYQRLAAACRALGWLHYLRFKVLPAGPNAVVLAMAICAFEPVANEPHLIPEQLRTVLGPAADAAAQVGLGTELLQHAMNTADAYLLQAVVSLLTAAVAATPDDHPDRGELLSHLMMAHRMRFERRGVLADLDRAIAIGALAVAATSDDHPERATYQSNLSAVHASRFARTGQPADLDNAIGIGEQALAAAPHGHRHRGGMLSNVGIAYLRRFERGGVLADLDHAIAIGAQAVAAVPDDHPERALYLCNVGIAYRLRFERVGTQADLDDAIGTGEQAVAAATDDHPDRARYLAHLGVAYRLRFERSGVLADLEQAVETAELAVAATPGDFPERAMWLSSLDTAYHRRFQNGGVLADLDLAVESGAQAVAASPPDHHRRGMFLSNLGDVYRLRFEHREVPADLDHAVAYGEQAVAATPDDLPDRGRYLTNLGIAYLRRFEHGAEPSDVDNAVETGKLAVAAVPQDHPERAMFLTNLGTAYHRRFEHRGALADLDDAIETCEQAVAAIPDGHANRAGMLSNLASTYRLRFGRRGLPADLDHAIEMCELAVAATPDHHVDRGMRLSNLGGFYRLRFERGGVLADLDHAVESCERAVAATPDSHPDRCGYLSSLGAAYRLRFDRGRATADLDRAVAAGEQSVATGQPGQANRLSSLGITYQQRFEQGGVLADLDRAIAAGEQAVATTPHDHHDRAAFLSNLVDPYRRRFSLGGARADLDRAVAVGEQAVAATPPDHPYRAHHLANLGIAYRARFQADGRRIDPATFHAVARDVSDAATASPTERARAGGVLGSLARAMGEHAAALELLDAAVAAMPLIPPRESGWADQEYRLGQHSGLVGEAVAVHCAVGDPAGAVVAAELGRGVLLAAQLDSRTDLTDLDHAEPELAQRFRQVRDQLNARDTDTADQTRHRKQLWADHDELLTRIREHPRFARFLMPPRLSDLRPAHGAVVLVNAVEGRGDAIIITSDAAPVVVPLSELRMTDVLANAMALLQATHDDTRLTGALRRQRVLTDVLGWLWTAIVDPALAALPDTGQAQRVWWLPIGLIGLFPLHAAGLPGQPGALDRVVSSYTPTLRALAHSRARPPATTRRQLTVALAHTPGLPDLPGTVAEATDLHPGTPPLTDQDATTGRVLAALPAATWAHFACHAYTDLATPSRGGLRLHDTTLPIPEISRLALAHAELAYLSACSTAHGGVIHVDESIHLASAFQLAGFRHVIASLWPLNDNIAATAARAFYRQLPDAPTAANAADVLRQVTLDLRANHPTRPDLWAPLIHSGP